MKMESSLETGSLIANSLGTVRRYRLLLALVLLVLCFAFGNDIYAAKKVADRHKDLLGPRRGIDASALIRQRAAAKTYHSDLKKRYLIDPKAAKQPTLLSAMSFQADICNQNTSFITSLPFTDSGTTAGANDDYDIDGDPTLCPAPTCVAFSGDNEDPGYTYNGTGLGRDVAYRIAFIQPTTLQITLDPTDPVGSADDMALIVYGPNCSSAAGDAIAVADNHADGNPGDLEDNSEQITFTTLPAGIYNIVVDGYSYQNAPQITEGPYTINVKCLDSGPCSIPGYLAPPRRNP